MQKEYFQHQEIFLPQRCMCKKKKKNHKNNNEKDKKAVNTDKFLLLPIPSHSPKSVYTGLFERISQADENKIRDVL